MTPTLLVEVREVYGTKKVYPVNRTAILFADLSGNKTLTPRTLHCAEELGYTVEVVTPKL